mmetsp:Transcript_144495/g.402566  ORF Transcript_144495/g.402566 Transcript_144495/m.402566 type:complete len:215 (-) Transcript_144495:103-747(-)
MVVPGVAYPSVLAPCLLLWGSPPSLYPSSSPPPSLCLLLFLLFLRLFVLLLLLCCAFHKGPAEWGGSRVLRVVRCTSMLRYRCTRICLRHPHLQCSQPVHPLTARPQEYQSKRTVHAHPQRRRHVAASTHGGTQPASIAAPDRQCVHVGGHPRVHAACRALRPGMAHGCTGHRSRLPRCAQRSVWWWEPLAQRAAAYNVLSCQSAGPRPVPPRT